jgi:hypothetical protein
MTLCFAPSPISFPPFWQTILATAPPSVSSAAGPALYGQAVTFSATLSATNPDDGIPTSTVTFLDGTTTLAADVVLDASGLATFSTSGLSVGTHTITALYAGDDYFTAATGDDSASPQVVIATSSTAITSSPNASVFGQMVTFTATVTGGAGGPGTPTGTVTFMEGTTALAAAVTLNGSGRATLAFSGLATGTHTITAVYNGDSSYQTSTGNDGGASQVVNKDGSGLVVTASDNPLTVGQTVTFTATVSASVPGGGTPSGTVSFQDNGVTIASSVSLSATGLATFTTSSLSEGKHTISASYAGDGNFLSSSGDDSASPELVGGTGISGSGSSISAVQGQQWSGTVATLVTDNNFNAKESETYTATIFWGDGTSSTGTISSTGTNSYSVSGTHTFTHAGSYTIKIFLSDSDSDSTGIVVGAATVTVS